MQNDLNTIKANTESTARIWSATSNRGNGKEAVEEGLAALNFASAAQRPDVTPRMSAVLSLVAPVLNSGTTPHIKVKPEAAVRNVTNLAKRPGHNPQFNR